MSWLEEGRVYNKVIAFKTDTVVKSLLHNKEVSFEMTNIVPFFNKKHPFSNFYPAKFTVRGVIFPTSEHFFMYRKAERYSPSGGFKERILATSDPAEAKQIGRRISNFDEKDWNTHSIEVMSTGIRNKFHQNPDLLKILLDTGDSILVEASPYDRIWGCGISESDPRINDPSKWTGKNQLGKILMQVREEFKGI